MKTEQNFDFRKRCCRMHHRIVGWKQRTPERDELVLCDGLTIALNGVEIVARTAAKDFKD